MDKMSRTLLSHVKDKIDNAKVVSFDIFDTLLLRPYAKPEDMFAHIEKMTGRKGFAERRKRAESEFYKTNGYKTEAGILDIYGEMGEFSDLKDMELDMEFAVLSQNSEMKTIYDYALARGKKVVATSDIYLPANFLNDVLKKNGFLNFAKLYISNTINKRKDRGDMYPHIIVDLGVSAHEIFHIGDNKHSDYTQARKYGLKAFHYPRICPRFLKSDVQFSKFHTLCYESLGASIITAMAAARPVGNDYWEYFGYIYAGPIIYGYSRWIYRNAISQNIKKILFVARDGYLPEKVFNTFNTANIQTVYTYAPRILNYTASLDYDPSLPEQARIICEHFGKPRKTHEYIAENRSEFLKLAADEKKKSGYSEYVRRLIGTESIVGVVDTISGQMSAQKLIGRESGVRTEGFYWLTLNKEESTMVECPVHFDFFTGDMRDAFLSDNKCDLIELIFSAPENPVLTVSGGKPVRQEKIAPEEKTRHEICRRIEKGAMDFARDISAHFNTADIYISQSDLFNLIKAYVENPSKIDIRKMFEVKKSPYADNNVYLPLFSADLPFWKVKKLKRLPWAWRTPLQNMAVVLSSPLRVRMSGLKRFIVILFPKMRTPVFTFILFGRYGISIGGGNGR